MSGDGKHDFPAFPQAYAERWRGAGLWLDLTLHDGFDTTVAAQPDAVALITRDRRYSFAEFKAHADALAAGLLEAGIGRGDLVAVQLPNWPEFCFLQIALSRIGAVIQPVHMVFRERELVNLLGFCDTDVIIVPERYGDFAHADAVRAVRGELPRLRDIVLVRPSAPVIDGHSVDVLLERGRSQVARLDQVRVGPDEVFYLNFTSGTEGNPKGFLHTHNSLISTMKKVADMIAESVPGPINLACSPMTHSYGHFTTYQCALAGIPMVLVDRYRPLDVLELIERERVSLLSGTPAHLIGLLHHADFARFDTSSIKSVGVGGARSSPELIAELERTWGVKSANTYGMGETIIHTRTMPADPEDKVRDTVGRPVLGAELKIVDPQARERQCAAGEVGEIAFRGPTLFVGYHKQPQLTAATRDEQGWFYTGDMGFVDEDGYLHFVGRSKEVINRGGSKVHPKEIEDLLAAHPLIRDVAVVGMPDPRLGERICAYVVPRGDAQLSLEAIREFLAERKATKYLWPETVINLAQMPMTPTGKVRKATLQEDAARRAEAQRAGDEAR